MFYQWIGTALNFFYLPSKWSLPSRTVQINGTRECLYNYDALWRPFVVEGYNLKGRRRWRGKKDTKCLCASPLHPRNEDQTIRSFLSLGPLKWCWFKGWAFLPASKTPELNSLCNGWDTFNLKTLTQRHSDIPTCEYPMSCTQHVHNPSSSLHIYPREPEKAQHIGDTDRAIHPLGTQFQFTSSAEEFISFRWPKSNCEQVSRSSSSRSRCPVTLQW